VPSELHLARDARRLVRQSYIAGYGRPALVAFIAVLIVSVSTSYIGTAAVWRAAVSPQQDPRSTGEVEVTSVKVSDTQLVLTANDSQTNNWKVEDGQMIMSLRGKLLGARYPYLMMKDSNFRGSEFFLEFRSANLETRNVKDVDLPRGLI